MKAKIEKKKRLKSWGGWVKGSDEARATKNVYT